MKRHRQLSLFYETLNKFVIVCQRKHLRLIIENPLSTSGMHYLTHFWCLKPNVIDKDRTLNGDYYKNLHNIGSLVYNLRIILFLNH